MLYFCNSNINETTTIHTVGTTTTKKVQKMHKNVSPISWYGVEPFKYMLTYIVKNTVWKPPKCSNTCLWFKVLHNTPKAGWHMIRGFASSELSLLYLGVHTETYLLCIIMHKNNSNNSTSSNLFRQKPTTYKFPTYIMHRPGYWEYQKTNFCSCQKCSVLHQWLCELWGTPLLQ